jgi:septum formation protein
VAWYVSTREPLDKAGAYALQGLGGALVETVSGSVSGVVGLPLAESLSLLREAGFPLPWDAP